MKLNFYSFILTLVGFIFLFSIRLSAQTTVSTTGFANNNTNASISFNFKNNNAFTVFITDIASICDSTCSTNVSAYYKTSAINGTPIPIDAGNGWLQFGSATINGIENDTTTTTQPFLSGLALAIPAGATYGIVVQALKVGSTTPFNLHYSTILTPGTYTFSSGGCDIITGTNIGYGSSAVPGLPVNTFTIRGFLGSVTFGLTPPCSEAPTGVPASRCGTGAVTLSATGCSGTYKWYNAVSGGTQVGTGASFTTPPLSVTTFYWASCTSAQGCESSRTPVTATINPLPAAVAGSNRAICTGQSTIIGTAAVAGSTYSWSSSPGGFTSIAANPTVSPTVTTTYILTETKVATGCTKQNSVTVTVSANPPVVTCPANFSVSIDTASFALSGGLPAGGTYSGPGVSGGNFNPVAAGVGVKTITYTYTSPVTGCSSSCTFTITVNSSQTQFIHGSVKKNTTNPSKIDIVFKPTYTSVPGEYITALQFALAIPDAISAGVTATAVGVNTFSNMGTLTPGIGPYSQNGERIFTWIFVNPTPSIQSWTAGVEFVGVEVTFSTTAAAVVGKMVDHTNIGGGTNGQTYFSMATAGPTPVPGGDPTDYANLFYAIPGQSYLGIYPSGDQFVQTDVAGGCTGAVGGTAVGSTSFYVSGTPTITASGYSSGAGSGYQWMSSTSPGDYPSTGSPVAGQTNPASLTMGVVSATTYYWLKVTCTNGSSTANSNLVTVSVEFPRGVVIAYPNPSSGQFQLRIFGQNQPLVLTVYDTNGLIVYKRSVTTGSTAYSRVDVTLPAATAGYFILDVRDASGKQIGKKQIMILR